MIQLKAQLDHGETNHKISIISVLYHASIVHGLSNTTPYRVTKLLLARRLLKWFDYALLYWRMVSVTLDAVTIVTCLTKRGREKKAVPAEAD